MQITDNTKRTLMNVGIFLLLMTVVSGFILYGREGYNQELIRLQFLNYGFYGVGALLTILVFYFLSKSENSENSEYSDSVMFASPGEPPALPTGNLFKNRLRLILLSIIVFVLLALLATFAQQTYLGVGNLEQQFTKTDNILFNWFMVVIAENAGIAALTAFAIVWLRRKAKQQSWGKWNYILITGLANVVLYALYGWINHQLRYAGSDASLQSVLQFWIFLGLVVWMTGEFITGIIAHGTNNTYVEFGKMIKAGTLSGDALVLYSLIAVGISAAAYVGTFFINKKGVKSS